MIKIFTRNKKKEEKIIPRFGISPKPYDMNVKYLIKTFIKEYGNLDTYDNDIENNVKQLKKEFKKN